MHNYSVFVRPQVCQRPHSLFFVFCEHFPRKQPPTCREHYRMLVNSLRLSQRVHPSTVVVGVQGQCSFTSAGCLPDPTTAMCNEDLVPLNVVLFDFSSAVYCLFSPFSLLQRFDEPILRLRQTPAVRQASYQSQGNVFAIYRLTVSMLMRGL